MTTQTQIAEVLRLERELQTSGCRTDPARVEELIADDYTEIGASGRLWDRASIITMLRDETADDDEIQVSELTGRWITDDLVLTRWTSDRGGRRAARSSLWRRDREHPGGSGEWRIVYHQGTLLPDPEG